MTVVRAVGRQAVTGAVLAPRRRLAATRSRATRARSPATSSPSRAASRRRRRCSLQGGAQGALRRGDRPLRRRRARTTSCTPPAPSPATRTPTRAELSGRIAGAEAALALSGDDGAAPGRARAGPRRAARPARAPSAVATPPAVARDGGSSGKAFVDLDEDVTTKDIALRRGRGLRLDRALQALHDGDDGPVAGPLLPARLDPRARRAHRADARTRSA